MFETLKNAWKITELRRKILFTIVMLFVFRLGGFIPIPGVDASAIQAAVGQYSALGLMDIMAGGNLGNFTFFALGVGPYITASIIMQLLTVAIPKLERLAKEGEEGSKKINQWTRSCGVVVAFVETIGIILTFMSQGAIQGNWLNYITIGFMMAAGSAICMWIGEQITEKGIGNGISLLIFVGIISRVPGAVISSVESMIGGTMSVWMGLASIVGVLLLIAIIVYVDNGQRRIPVQYAKRVVGRKMYGGQSTHIPVKVNASGVLPIIFAISLVNFPLMIAEFWPQSAFYAWYSRFLNAGSPLYMIIYGLLIIFFTYFYTTISFNPIEVSKNLQQNGGFIPGIRPGRPTSDYLMKVTHRITLFGAFFLALLAVIPSTLTRVLGVTGIASVFTASGILIAVSVALETSKQLESQMIMRNYKGFLK